MRFLHMVPLCAAVLLPVCRAQVVRLTGAADSNTSGATGAAVSLYEEDSTTVVGASLQQGIHLGGRREISSGNSSLTLGDSTIEMPLPSDLENTPRSFLARGLLLRSGTSNTVLFAGFTGAANANSFMTAVVPSRFFGVLSNSVSMGRFNVSTLLTRGVRSNNLISVSHERNPFWRFAVTAGRSESSNIVRILALRQGKSYRLVVSEGFGNLQLQPSVANQTAALERIGFNILATRSFGRHWTLDGARHSYSTADVNQNPLYLGVTAPRSELLEAGAILHVAHLQVQGRVLKAKSGAQESEGAFATAAWTAQRWSVQATLLQSHVSMNAATTLASTNTASRSVYVQTAQQVSARLRVEQTASFGGTSTSTSFGGSWTGDRFGFSVTHHQMFVPFGTRSGFHSVLLIGARLRLGGNETSATVSRGGGLPATVLVCTDGYYGGLQDSSVPQAAPVHLARFLVQGRVRTAAGTPVRGAAVRIASIVVYTDSEGRFVARFNRNNALPVSLAPEQFVTAEDFRAVSPETWIRPTPEGGEIALIVERCSGCNTVTGQNLEQSSVQDAAWTQPQKRGVVMRTAVELSSLARRMFTWRHVRHDGTT